MSKRPNIPMFQRFNVSTFPLPPCALWAIFLALDLLLILGGGYARFNRARAWTAVLVEDVRALQTFVQEGPEAVAPCQPEELLQHVQADLIGIRDDFALALWLAPHFRWVPVYGEDLAAAPVLLQSGLDLTTMGLELYAALQPLLETTPTRNLGESSALETSIKVLREATPQLRWALTRVERIQQARQTIQTSALSPYTARWVMQLDEVLPLLEDGLRGAVALPTLLGTSEQRTYLLLAENEDELRATGGFITAVAQVVVRNGRVVHMAFENSGQVDDFSQPYPDPPLPLREIMDLDLWGFRDANWSPDFPTAAQVALRLYRPPYHVGEIHGVMAINMRGAQRLVEVLEPLYVEDYPEPVTGENLIPAMRESRNSITTDRRARWERAHKDFMARVLTAAIDKIQREPEHIDMLKLAMAILQALEERNLFIYPLGSGPAAEAMQRTGWDGALRAGPGDYLMVVDANLGYNKVNAYIAESVDYSVDLQEPRRPQATLTLQYDHQGPQTRERCYHFQKPPTFTYDQLMAQCHWNYARVYVPEGSQLLHATANPVPGRMLETGKGRTGEAEVTPHEHGKTVFATFFVLPSGQRNHTRFTYTLPPTVVTREKDTLIYQLYIQRQGGKDPTPLSVTLLLPPNAEVIAASPPPVQQNGNHIHYTRALHTDLDLKLELRIKD
jgi:hypothetical protein